MFENVCIDTVVHVDAPVRVTSADIVERLRPTLARLDLRPDLLEAVAGIRARRIWDGPTPVADAATAAGRLALESSGTLGSGGVALLGIGSGLNCTMAEVVW